MEPHSTRRPLIAAGLLLGIGMGGFVDGILFHQILQVHSMLSNWVPRDSIAHLEINMFFDGLFHAFTWLTTALGLGLLWRALTRPDGSRSGGTCLGAMLLGWGSFNLVEGLIDHEILQLHHVYQNGAHLFWDLMFLGSGVFFLGAGWALIRRAGTVFDAAQMMRSGSPTAL